MAFISIFWTFCFRHVILGFTKSGKYLISYCLKIESDDASPVPSYHYSLHWWQFDQQSPLVQVGNLLIHFLWSDCRKSVNPLVTLKHHTIQNGVVILTMMQVDPGWQVIRCVPISKRVTKCSLAL